MTLGMLSPSQVGRLKEAGLDFYNHNHNHNHNIDTSPPCYARIATTRRMEDWLETLSHVREGGIQVCCGGILGMGEDEDEDEENRIACPPCRAIPKACRSTCGSLSRARRSRRLRGR